MNLPRIIHELGAGNLVITPTDTIYGILADALNESAVEKVKVAKHRDAQKPLLLLMSDLDMLRAYTEALTPLEQGIIETYFPGPLTILLQKTQKSPTQSPAAVRSLAFASLTTLSFSKSSALSGARSSPPAPTSPANHPLPTPANFLPNSSNILPMSKTPAPSIIRLPPSSKSKTKSSKSSAPAPSRPN